MVLINGCGFCRSVLTLGQRFNPAMEMAGNLAKRRQVFPVPAATAATVTLFSETKTRA